MKFLCNKILLAFLIVFIGTKVFALNIIYPTSETMTTNANASFFAGNTNPEEELFINGEKINVHQSGAFAKKVPLNIGSNTFEIKTGKIEKTYTINRKAQLEVAYNNSNYTKTFKEYKKIKYVYVNKDNTALRKTPSEYGINRLSHLEKDTILRVDGELYNLYRVKLSDNKFAWINKNNTYTKIVDEDLEPANLLDKQFEKENNVYLYKFKLDKKIPYYVEEANPLILHLFNTNGEESVLKLDLNHNLIGYDAYYIDNTLFLEIRKKLDIKFFRPLRDITIVIDAGHGGNEKGAISCLGDCEKDINLKIALYLYKELSKKGANLYMTRFTDEYVDLNERVNYSNKKKADIFISIHANSIPDGKNPETSNGASVYYYYDQAKPLSECILNNMVDKLKIKNDGIYQRSFAVVRNSRALSLLIETGYVINPEDNVMLRSETFQKNCAKAITQGILEYLKKV